MAAKPLVGRPREPFLGIPRAEKYSVGDGLAVYIVRLARSSIYPPAGFWFYHNGRYYSASKFCAAVGVEYKNVLVASAAPVSIPRPVVYVGRSSAWCTVTFYCDRDAKFYTLSTRSARLCNIAEVPTGYSRPVGLDDRRFKATLVKYVARASTPQMLKKRLEPYDRLALAKLVDFLLQAYPKDESLVKAAGNIAYYTI